MKLNETLQSLYGILGAAAPDTWSLKEKGTFYKEQNAKARFLLRQADECITAGRQYASALPLQQLTARDSA